MNLFKRSPDDPEIVSAIRRNDAKVAYYEKELFRRYHYLIDQGKLKHKLDEDQVSMAYSDTILSTIVNIRNGKFEGTASLKTYLNRIFFNKCVDIIRSGPTKVSYGSISSDVIENMPAPQSDIIQQLMKQERIDLLQQNLSRLGEKCRAILSDWSYGFSDKEMAEKLGYNSSAVLQTTRLRCIQKLKELCLNQWKREI